MKWQPLNFHFPHIPIPHHHHHTSPSQLSGIPQVDDSDVNQETKRAPLMYQLAIKAINEGDDRRAREIIFAGSNAAVKERNQELAIKFGNLLNNL